MPDTRAKDEGFAPSLLQGPFTHRMMEHGPFIHKHHDRFLEAPMGLKRQNLWPVVTDWRKVTRKVEVLLPYLKHCEGP